MLKPIGFLNLSPELFKEKLNKLKYHSKKSFQGSSDRKNMHTYVQTLTGNVKDILKLKENFSNLSAKKIENIHNIHNKTNKLKPYINMTTKDSLCKQIIISMSSNNINKFIVSLSKHVAGLNYALKSIKSDNFINFTWVDYHSFIVTPNKVMFPSDLNVVENYIKNFNSKLKKHPICQTSII